MYTHQGTALEFGEQIEEDGIAVVDVAHDAGLRHAMCHLVLLAGQVGHHVLGPQLALLNDLHGN